MKASPHKAFGWRLEDGTLLEKRRRCAMKSALRDNRLAFDWFGNISVMGTSAEEETKRTWRARGEGGGGLRCLVNSNSFIDFSYPLCVQKSLSVSFSGVYIGHAKFKRAFSTQNKAQHTYCDPS